MTDEEFQAAYPKLENWIRQTISGSASAAQTIASLGFKRLSLYFSPELLASAKVVYGPNIPKPPLGEIGFNQFGGFEAMPVDGITYWNTFFSRDEMRGNERHHFHELIHVIQWSVLGPKNFVAAYADGLGRVGYRQSPLEVMAYTLDKVFSNGGNPFDVAAVVVQELGELYHGSGALPKIPLLTSYKGM